MAKEDDCVLGARNEQRLTSVERNIKDINDVVNEIRDKLLARPSWAITFWFTGTTGVIIALTSALLHFISEAV